jgi:hypothetical protein
MPGRVESVPPDAVTAMATHDDTIVLDASPVTTGPRLKRVKTEHSSHSPATSFDAPHNVSWPPSAPTPTTAESPFTQPPLANRSGQSRSREASFTAASPQAEQVPEGPVLRKIKTPSLRLRLAQGAQPESQSPRRSPAPKPHLIDFAVAPTDPTEFVWWFAHQIASVPSASGFNGADPLPGFDSMTSIMRPLSMFSQGPDHDPNIVREKEREKQRVDNRERKKRWRETNAERSMFGSGSRGEVARPTNMNRQG